jgi:hypothetical protein
MDCPSNSGVCRFDFKMTMKNSPAAQLAAKLHDVNDQELRQEVMRWRIQAIGGDLEAHKVARVLALEELRRLQSGLTTISPSVPIPASPPWWKFW